MKLRSILLCLGIAGLAAVASPLQAQGAAAPAKSDAPRAEGARQRPAQQSYATPEDAARALYEAMQGDDVRRIFAVLGPGSGPLLYTGDKVADKTMRENFAAAYAKSAKFDRQGDASATLLIGERDYPFPFPLVKRASGWQFDARAGANEIVNRRIGENELSAIQSCLAVVDAQREYVLADRNANGLREYAQKFVSSPGKRDGLYWPTAPGEPPSPLGPAYEEAARQGYTTGKSGGAYHGYRFRMLTSQGKDAPGGAYDYIVDGKMIGGFGVVAWPARYGVSGVMTFTCNHDGVVYQKNLGRATPEVASKMTQFNPDASWEKTAP